MAQQGTGNVKQTLPFLGNAYQVRSKKDNGYTERGTLIQDSREKARGEGERKPLREAKPPNLLNIAFLWACIF